MTISEALKALRSGSYDPSDFLSAGEMEQIAHEVGFHFTGGSPAKLHRLVQDALNSEAAKRVASMSFSSFSVVPKAAGAALTGAASVTKAAGAGAALTVPTAVLGGLGIAGILALLGWGFGELLIAASERKERKERKERERIESERRRAAMLAKIEANLAALAERRAAQEARNEWAGV